MTANGPALRAITLIVLLGAGIVISRLTPLGEQLTEERIVAALVEIQSVTWAPAALLLLYAALSPLGVSMVALIVAGSIFGPVPGAIYNSIGLVLGAVTSYWLARCLGRDFVMRVAGTRFQKARRWIDRHGFWPLVQTRFLPLPFVAVNYAAALAGVDPRRFVVASIAGLVPSTIIHTFFISRIIFASGEERALYGVGYGLVFLACNLAMGIPWMRAQFERRSRYRAIMELRADRESKTAA